MVGKTPLILAPLIVGLAVLAAAFYAGRWWAKTMQRYEASYIPPGVHTAMIDVLHRILSPTDPELACFLPDEVKAQAVKALTAADEALAARRREELRRRY